MNAYELADEITKCTTDPLHNNVANMLRQQADRIAELEKQLYFKDYYEELPETPVGFLNRGKRVARQMPPPEGLIDPKSYYIGYEDGKKAPQTKPLSDDEIDYLVDKCSDFIDDNDSLEFRYNDFARAIEEKHGIK